MLGEIKKVDGKDTILFMNANYQGNLNKEGYFKVTVSSIDASTSEKNYIVMYVVEMEKEVIHKAHLRTKRLIPTNELPLEKFIRLAIENELEEGWYCYEVDLGDLIGLECQILVERVNGYFNITDVFPIDAELGEFVSQEEQRRKVINERFPNGIFNE